MCRRGVVDEIDARLNERDEGVVVELVEMKEWVAPES